MTADIAGAPAPRAAAPLRVVFMGTPVFACATLQALSDAGHGIAAVYTQPPRPAGRGKKLRPSPVHTLAERLGLPVRTPERLKAPEDQAAFAELKADVAVVVAYGLLLPKPVLDAPRLGCLNLHASLLPRWRGAAPIHRAVMAGDAESGVCVMRMTEGLDEGPVLMRAATPIGPDDTTGSLHDRLSAIGAPLICDALKTLAAGSAVETPQPEEGVTYAKKIDKAEARIDWRAPAAAVDRLVRGLSPSPGAWFEDAEGARVKALLSETVSIDAAQSATPGLVLDAAPTIACGDGGAVRLRRLQRAGKAAQDAEAFQTGRGLRPGEALS